MPARRARSSPCNKEGTHVRPFFSTSAPAIRGARISGPVRRFLGESGGPAPPYLCFESLNHSNAFGKEAGQTTCFFVSAKQRQSIRFKAPNPRSAPRRAPLSQRGGTDRRDIRDASSIPRRPSPAQGRRLSAAQRCAPRSPHPHSIAFHRSGRDRPARGCPRAGRGCRAAGRCGIRAARRRARCGTPRGRGSGR